MKKLEWDAKKIELGKLETYGKNPRTITDQSYDKLKESLDELGVFRPFILDFNETTIIGGNQRSRALLEKLPLDHEVVCMVPNRELTQKEKEKVLLQDNSHFGKWDFDIIANEFDLSIDEIKDLGTDIYIPFVGATGEEFSEFQDLADGNAPPEEKGNSSDQQEKKYIIEVTFPNDMEMMDIHDDLVSRGYVSRVKQ